MGPLNWWRNRQRTKEIERDMETRRGKAQMRRHIKKQNEMSKKLWGLGRRALQLGDQRQFRQIGKHYLWTLEDIKRWERYMLAFETIEARRDQARSMAEFMRSVQAMSQSMLANASPKAIAETQRDLQLGIARAQDMEQTLDDLMDMTEDTVFGMEEMGDEEAETAFHELERAMAEEGEGATAAPDEALDSRIAAGLRQIEAEMRKDLRK